MWTGTLKQSLEETTLWSLTLAKERMADGKTSTTMRGIL